MPLSPTIEEIRRKQIIEATLFAISKIGAANITMRDIAKAAGLSNGGLAHYFSSKEILFKTVFKEFYQRIFERSRKELDEKGDPLEKLLGFGAFFDEIDPDVSMGYPLIFDCMSLAVHEQEYKNIFDEWLENWIILLRAAIDEGIKKKIFKKNIDADAVSRMISSVYLGMSIRWYLARESNSTKWAIRAFKESIKSIMKPYLV